MVLASAEEVLHSYWDGLRPPPLITVSEWADRHRMLSQRASTEPGRWRTSRTPYLREIMDALSVTSSTETVVFMAAAQLGKTEAGLNWLGYIIHAAPAPTLSVQPSLDGAQRNSRARIEPMIRECPVLRSRVAPPMGREGGNTVLQKLYAGGVLYLAGANSPLGLRSVPVKNLHLDEIDGYPEDCGGEGDPVDLATARTTNFPGRKRFISSTPTTEGDSRIAQLFEESDQRYYHVPCPDCDHYQRLVWTSLRWEDGNPKTSRYACASCGSLIGEHAKGRMNERGVWVPMNPGHEVRGYQLSTLYSPWFTWREMAAAFLKANREGPDKLRVFVNTKLGETYLEKGQVPEWEELYKRRETYRVGTVPAGGCVVTAGADVQKDRIEVGIVAWGPRLESWHVDHVVIPGDTETEKPWDELDKLLVQSFPHENGAHLPIRMLAVDSGFATTHVYNWTRRHDSSRVMAVKGGDNPAMLVGQPTKVDYTWQGRKIARGALVWSIGSGLAKSEAYGWLRRKAPVDPEEPLPDCWIHFPQFEQEWFKQLCSEHVAPRRVHGRRRPVWEKLRERNEALDCRVYARAAAYVLGVDRWTEGQWNDLAASLAPPEMQKLKSKHPRAREGFLDRWRGPKHS